jgi:hypothetical protein
MIRKGKKNGKVNINVWKILNKFPMPDFLADYMPIAIFPWALVDSVNAINRWIMPALWDSIRNSNGLRCDSALTISNLHNGDCIIQFTDFGGKFEFSQMLKEVWSRKFGWWINYERTIRGNPYLRARLISKNEIHL